MSSKKKDNPLANQLSKLDLDLPKGPDAPRRKPEKSGDKPQQETPREQAPLKEEHLSDEELFLRAVDQIDPARLYDGKFRGEAGASLPEPPPPEDSPAPSNDQNSSQPTQISEDEAREQVGRVRDAAFFEKMVGPVTPLEDRDKYHHGRIRRSPPEDDDDQDGHRDAAAKLSTPLLPRQGPGLNQVPPLDQTQYELLQRYKRATKSIPAPELHIRGDKRDDAIVSLARFTAAHYRKNTPFIRIIHGRGLRSEGEPVLKPAVLAWLEGPGLEMICGYVPEITRGGDYGALIVELET